MADVIVPTGNAGEFEIPSLGKKIKLVEWREDSFYDTVQLDALAPAAGSSLEFFRDLANKNLQHTNLKTVRRIPSNTEFIMTRIGVVPNQALGNVLPTDEDVIKLAYAASLTMKLNDRLIVEGPLYKFQSGLGVAGSTTRNATGIVTMGVASAGAAPSLLVAQSVKDTDDLVATLDHRNTAWLATTSLPTYTVRMGVTLDLHGLIKKPQGA